MMSGLKQALTIIATVLGLTMFIASLMVLSAEGRLIASLGGIVALLEEGLVSPKAIEGAADVLATLLSALLWSARIGFVTSTLIVILACARLLTRPRTSNDIEQKQSISQWSPSSEGERLLYVEVLGQEDRLLRAWSNYQRLKTHEDPAIAQVVASSLRRTILRALRSFVVFSSVSGAGGAALLTTLIALGSFVLQGINNAEIAKQTKVLSTQNENLAKQIESNEVTAHINRRTNLLETLYKSKPCTLEEQEPIWDIKCKLEQVSCELVGRDRPLLDEDFEPSFALKTSTTRCLDVYTRCIQAWTRQTCTAYEAPLRNDALRNLTRADTEWGDHLQVSQTCRASDDLPRFMGSQSSPADERLAELGFPEMFKDREMHENSERWQTHVMGDPSMRAWLMTYAPKTNLSDTVFRGMLLNEIDCLERVDFSGSSMIGSWLTGIRFVGAKLVGTDMTAARVFGDFSSVDARNSQWLGAELNHVRFTRAELRQAQFVFADIEQTLFIGADLEQANFRGSRWLGVVRADSAMFSSDFEEQSKTIVGALCFDKNTPPKWKEYTQQTNGRRYPVSHPWDLSGTRIRAFLKEDYIEFRQREGWMLPEGTSDFVRCYAFQGSPQDYLSKLKSQNLFNRRPKETNGRDTLRKVLYPSSTPNPSQFFKPPEPRY